MLPLKSIMTSAFPAKFSTPPSYFLVLLQKQQSDHLCLYMAIYYFNDYNYKQLTSNNPPMARRSIVKKVLRC